MSDYRTRGTPFFIVIDPNNDIAFGDFSLDADKLIQAFTIVINKQMVKAGGALSLSDMLYNVGIEGEVQVADTPVLEGGPVDIDRGFVLHSADYFKRETSLKLSDTLSLTSTKDVLEALGIRPEMLSGTGGSA